MPDADPLTSVGYLVAAAGITVITLVTYGILIVRRLAAAKVRSETLARDGS